MIKFKIKNYDKISSKIGILRFTAITIVLTSEFLYIFFSQQFIKSFSI
jgi:hypothetical protein